MRAGKAQGLALGVGQGVQDAAVQIVRAMQFLAQGVIGLVLAVIFDQHLANRCLLRAKAVEQ